jgi:hypothetical protein
MRVFVTVTSFQGCIDEVQLFMKKGEADEYAETWEIENGITNDDERHHESGQGTCVEIHIKELAV